MQTFWAIEDNELFVLLSGDGGDVVVFRQLANGLLRVRQSFFNVVH